MAGQDTDRLITDTAGPSSTTSSQDSSTHHHTYQVYGRRWFILVIAVILNLTNAGIWITFSPIADLTATFYWVTLNEVNWLAMIYMVVFLVLGFFSAWIVDTLGLRTSLIVGTTLNGVGAALRVVSALDVIDVSTRYPILLIGQGLAAAAQPLAMIIPVKVAALWFAADQRGLATAIGMMSNPSGIMIANILSPIILDDDVSRMLWLMVAHAILPVSIVFMALFGVCHSTPPTPPSPSADEDSEPFFKGLKKCLKSKNFWLICVCFGIGLACVTALSTLIQQILCPYGYSDRFSGICGSLLIAFGVVLAGITGLIVDRWKIYEEVAKVYWCMAALSYVAFVELARIPNIPVAVGAAVSIAGMFTFPLFPLTVELAIESTYPVAEATSSSCILIVSQFFSLIMVLVMESLTTDMPLQSEYSFKNCNQGNSTKPNQDYTRSNLTMLGMIVFAAIVFVICYKCKYRRMKAEHRRAALRILQLSRSSTDSGQIVPREPGTIQK